MHAGCLSGLRRQAFRAMVKSVATGSSFAPVRRFYFPRRMDVPTLG